MAQATPHQTSRITVRIVHQPPMDKKSGKPTILVIEDEPVLLSLSRMVLENSGYEVIEASSGDEAMGLWQEKRDTIDLVLTDMIMPGSLSGSQVAQLMREDCPGLKVIYSSGYSMDVMHDETGEKDPESFLPKPYVPSKLVSTVRNRLNKTAV